MKKKIFLTILLVCSSIFLFSCTSKDSPKVYFEKYITAWNKSDYKTMYSLLSPDSKSKISEKDFVNKYTNIYSGIQLSKLTISPNYPSSYTKDSNGNVSIPFNVTMNTVAGKVSFNDTASLKENKGSNAWTINWSNKMIFKDLGNTDKVRVNMKFGKRGEIKGLNGAYLAQNGTAKQIGIIPGKLGSNASDSKNKIASILNLDVNNINKELSASYVTQDMFIPIATISSDASDKLSALSAIPGVSIHDVNARVYPLKESAAFLTGYVQPVSSDDLKKLKGKGYNSDDVIGKSGLEKIYENQLRSTDGAEIYITDKYGNKIKTIANKEPKNGKDLNLTIDTNMQKAIYAQYGNDSGASVALNPKTGAVMALVSAPAYDPNDFVLGMSKDKWSALQNNPQKPFSNRFQSTFAPGSTFKPITAAIALNNNKLNPDAAKDISGLKWQENSSWGNYYVTRDETYTEPANLLNAFVHSDNIYFAKTALDIGKDNFIKGVKSFGLGEKLPFEFGMYNSEFSTNNTIKDDIQLADSGYGQGQIMMNPLHLADIYTSFVNNGNIIKPYLTSDKSAKTSTWKTNVFSSNTANLILNDLTQVVNSNEGTGHGAYMANLPLAGKTGTAEIKATQNDPNGTENGWFVAVNTNDPKLLVLEMYENVKTKGGSAYVTPKVKDIFQQFCK
ncbi:MAG: penicillin-binding transpeptidase domain-containing protein [Clostridium sp.]|nr:penicillin-binding transpeptidase domain-containing protein [Clostridium sp.]